jgi:hypothetical protein
MQVGDLVDDGLGNIGIITVVDKNRLCSPYFAQFFNTYDGDGDDITGWYTDGDLEVL